MGKIGASATSNINTTKNIYPNFGVHWLEFEILKVLIKRIMSNSFGVYYVSFVILLTFFIKYQAFVFNSWGIEMLYVEYSVLHSLKSKRRVQAGMCSNTRIRIRIQIRDSSTGISFYQIHNVRDKYRLSISLLVQHHFMLT